MATTKKSEARSADKGLMVSAKRESFYSGGQTTPFGFEPRFVPFAALTAEQEEELRNDPYIVAIDADAPVTPPEK
ncbi:MAG: hypothetical protein B7Y42_00520 [Polaromonas sp. 28-63-22]|jgi:hypothetical protein|nr:MAG: hypothetical protein B7Y42_00520 [Polaromonas sp. 28-63-22]